MGLRNMSSPVLQSQVILGHWASSGWLWQKTKVTRNKIGALDICRSSPPEDIGILVCVRGQNVKIVPTSWSEAEGKYKGKKERESYFQLRMGLQVFDDVEFSQCPVLVTSITFSSMTIRSVTSLATSIWFCLNMLYFILWLGSKIKNKNKVPSQSGISFSEAPWPLGTTWS